VRRPLLRRDIQVGHAIQRRVADRRCFSMSSFNLLPDQTIGKSFMWIALPPDDPRQPTAWRAGRRGTNRCGLPGTGEGWKRGRGPSAFFEEEAVRMLASGAP